MTSQTIMSPERTEAVLKPYLQDLIGGGDFARYFADDVTVSIVWSDMVARGREPARELITGLHRTAFKAAPVITNLFCGEGKALLEADFIATQIAPFAGRPAAGKKVQVPYCAVYDLKDDKITQLRLYFPMEVLLRQLDA